NVILSDFSRLCPIRVTSVLSCESHPTKIRLLVKASSPSVLWTKKVFLVETSFLPEPDGNSLSLLHDELLENGGEWARLATNPFPSARVATCRTVLILRTRTSARIAGPDHHERPAIVRKRCWSAFHWDS